MKLLEKLALITNLDEVPSVYIKKIPIQLKMFLHKLQRCLANIVFQVYRMRSIKL